MSRLSLACILVWGAALLVMPALSSAQEPSGLAAAIAVEKALVEAIAKAERSVVAIARVRPGLGGDELAGPDNPFRPRLRGNLDADEPSSPEFIPSKFGSGVVIDRVPPPGGGTLILTNYHVIDDAFLEGSETVNQITDSLYVWVINSKLDPPRPQVYPATVKAADPRSDLAVLEIRAELEPIRLAAIRDAETDLKKGQLVVALGNPYAIARDGSVSASSGIIANVGRKLGPKFVPANVQESTKPTLNHYGALIQTDARLNLGASGGALINLKGELIGLTTSQAALSGYEQSAGFAIPVDDTFRRVVDTLKQGREVEYGFLGISPRNLNHVERQQGQRGIVIGDVRPGSPAFGRLEVEEVVLAVNGKPIFDADGLVLHVGRLPVGEPVRLSLAGNRQVDIPLSKYPVHGRKIVTKRPLAWRGLRVDYTTAIEEYVQMPQRPFYLPLVEGAVAVIDVDLDSQAAAAGLQKKTLITHVDNVRVKTPQEFREAVAGKKGKVRLRLGVEAERPVEVTIDP